MTWYAHRHEDDGDAERDVAAPGITNVPKDEGAKGPHNKTDGIDGPPQLQGRDTMVVVVHVCVCACPWRGI